MLAHPARMHHQRAAREPLLTVHHACAPRAMSVHANGAAVRMPLSGGGTSATRACQERPCPPLLALAWRARHHLGFHPCFHPANCLFLFENAKQTETAERKSIFISSRSTMAFQTLAQNSARQRHAERIGSDPARINAVRTDPTPHRTDAPVGLVRTRSNRCGPNQSDASSNRCVRRIASGPARIGADRTDSARLGPVRRAGLMRARLGLVRRSH